MEVLKDVVGIIDMDGFYVHRSFLCKELGIMRVGATYAESYFFDINVRWSDLDNETKRQCSYVIRNIHRLPFGVPQGVRSVRLSQLNEIVTDFYERHRRGPGSTLAFKGGHFERDLLTRLNIPSADLEAYECPKADSLICDLGWVETCGNHMTFNAFDHCPKVEVESYEQWLSAKL